MDLFERVKEDFEREESTAELSFNLGDAWTGAVLLGQRADNNDVVVGVIDWEFAGFSRGLAGDIAQLLAHFHLSLLSAAAAGSSLYEILRALISSLTTTYREISVRNGSLWTKLGTSTVVDENALAMKAMRSTLLLYGREMINNSIERGWSCSCCESRQIEDCDLRKLMVEKGVWCLRSAGPHQQAFKESIGRDAWKMEDSALSGLFNDIFEPELQV